MHTYIHTYIHTNIETYIHTYVHAYIPIGLLLSFGLGRVQMCTHDIKIYVGPIWKPFVLHV